VSEGDPIVRRAAFLGVLLFLIGLVTGYWSALAATKVHVPIPHLALAAHLNGLLGGLWLVAVALTLPMLSYGERGKKRLVAVVAVVTYANWLITLGASFVGVRGIEITGDHANDFVAFLLQLFVVLPALGACGAWAWGFRRRA
jgi:(hydroxyamino)benzene mutase